ncbi:hypothetical protein [Variovorax sp.]|uniref:hypothetical protein n=1 Tax=Variovorax sp. TaxID=1871043 RepID=UPI003BAB4F7B
MFIKASQFCREVHNRYESGANQAGIAQTAVSVAGTAAGIVAVSTTGTANKVFSAMSGSTNALQLAMSNALSAAAELKRQTAVGTAASDWSAKYLLETDATRKQELAIEMTNQCWLASAKAEQQIIQAVSAPASSPAAQAAQATRSAEAAQLAAQTATQAATRATESAKAAKAARGADTAEPVDRTRTDPIAEPAPGTKTQ